MIEGWPSVVTDVLFCRRPIGITVQYYICLIHLGRARRLNQSVLRCERQGFEIRMSLRHVRLTTISSRKLVCSALETGLSNDDAVVSADGLGKLGGCYGH
jgi:hypothetical protein